MEKLICNPLNLEYRYQIKKSPMGESIFREAADPTMVLFQDTYFLFASMTGGFWYSDDLHIWHFKETPELPIYDYAPDVRVIKGKVLFSASRRGEPCSFFTSANPLSEPFVPVAALFDFWDPDIYEDDDGRIYFYWGCSNSEPIWGVEINPDTWQPVGEKIAVIHENEAEHGWERKGENNKLTPPKTEMEKLIRQHVGYKPFIEGAFMTKNNGKYYLQYAAPGTECNVYADGVYVGEGPMGPFEYQAHNPFSSKPGGFITSAGHGSTFLDKHGNWWHISTMRISMNENFERRIGLFPCGFDMDGILYCNQNFADYPFMLPAGQRDNNATPTMQNLSYNKKATASSYQPGYEPSFGTDENIQTWWAAEKTGNDQWYQIDLGAIYAAKAVQINFADHQLSVPNCKLEEMHAEAFGHRLIQVKPSITAYELNVSNDGENWRTIHDTRGKGTDLAHDFIAWEQPESFRYIRLSNMRMPYNAVPAVSGLRIFGNGNGALPASVSHVSATRENRLNILLRWEASDNADGYNVRYGIAPDKLYNCWQLQGAKNNTLDLSMVNSNTGYYIAVDSFNENGISTGTTMWVE